MTNNSAESGGGVHNDEGTLDISNSIISGNTAMTNGGGVVNTGISTLTNSVISGNTAANGGGLHNGGGAGSGPEIISIINTTIAGNAASSRGGGIYNLTGISRFTNSIVAANTDDGSGPDIFKDSGTITNNGNNLIGINKDVLTEFPEGPLVGTTTSPLDPLFVDMADMAMLPNTSGDLRLQCGSPAIDVGKADTTGLNLGTVDIAGMSRIVTKTVDIGAYEFQLSQAPTPLTLVTNTNDAGCGSLRFAICNAMPGDTIRFNPSIDGNTIKLTSGEIVIDTTIHIFGNDSSKTIIDGQGLNRLFSIQPGDTLYIDKVTLQNGDATIPESNGGAIFNEGFLSVKNSLLKNNYTNGNGGAIYNTNGSSIQLTASFFLENTASFGGGIYFSGNSSATADATSFSKNNGLTNGGAIFMKDSSSAMLSNLTFSSNEAFDGGAVYNNSSDTMSCSQVTFSQNSARSFGGAIYSESGNILFEKSHLILNSAVVQGGAIDTRANTTIQFSNSIVSGNTARLSAGISNGGKATITNSIISGNKAEINSGGIANSGTASLKNVTITGNEAVLAGGIANVGTTTLVNTIVAKNIATDAHPDIYKANGTVNNNGSNLIGINSSIEMEFPADGYLVGTLLSPVDPWFISDALPAPESSVEFQLACGSPAVDAGTPDTTGLGLAGTDIIGLPRIVGKRIDIGAYELQESSYPDDITHVTNTNDAGCGSLRFAICNAMPGDTVTFDSSIDGNTIRLFTGEIVIDTNLVILGNDSTKTIIDGQANSRIFHIPEGDSVYIKGLTLQNGNAVGVGITLLGGPYGGAIQNGGVLHLSDCNIANNSITGNTASWGGGIYNAGEVFIDNCTFQNNRAKTGGAIFSSGNSTITGCIISKNRVFRENSHGGSGAGIYNSALLSNTIMNISNSAITGNIIENDSGSGGGVSNAGTLAILNSTISGNTGNNGGGVYNDGTASFTNSSISGNTSSVFGGGMYNTASATASFNNTTISGNSASSLGGGLYNTGSATANFNNSIIALNAASSRGQDIDKNSGTINSKNSLIGTDSGDHGIMNGANGNQVGTDASPLAPLFVMMVDTSSLPNTTGDLSLACGSPAIDAGTPDTTGLNIGLSDINGMPRIAGTAIDMGAYEKENVCQNINVFGNGILIAKQDNTPDISDGTSLGETCNTLVDTFYIKNDKQLLIIDNIAITPVNSNPGSFTSNQATFPDTIIGGDSLLIQITFNPTQTGADGALVTIESNDLDDDPFTFIIAAAKDTTPPTSLCQDIEVTLDRLGNASITPEQLNMNSSDNCNIQGYTVSKSTFTCADIGTNEVMLTVTDVNGNSSSCTSSVTVKDMTFSSPTISGPTSICPSSSGWNYAVPVNPDVAVYQWSYSGSGVTINGNGTSNVNLDFSTNATSGVLSVDLVSVCGNTGGSATLALEIASPEACNLARCLERNLFIDSELLQINSSPQYFKVDGKITTNAMVQQYLELIASGGIEIYPGFTVESSDEFVARIEACAAALHQKSENKN